MRGVTINGMSKTVAVADLAANLEAVLDEVAQTREEVVVTRDGKEVAKVVPLADMPLEDVRERRRRALEKLRGSVTVHGDIVAPLDEEWEANK